MAADFEIKKDSKGEWYWTFQAENNKTIAKSTDGYRNRQDCLHAISLIRTVGKDCSVWDMSTPGSPKIVSTSEIK